MSPALNNTNARTRDCTLKPGWLCALFVSVLAVLATLSVALPTAEAAEGPWEYAPYRIRLTLAVEAQGDRQSWLEQHLVRYLQQRVDTAIGPIWSLEIEIAQADQRSLLVGGLQGAALPDLVGPDTDAVAQAFDKLLFVSVQDTPAGTALEAREYDTYVAHLGATIRDWCHQPAALPERVFQLVRRTFAPLARLELDPDDEERVLLVLQGTKVAPKDASLSWVGEQDVFLPYLRRTTRDGELVENGLQAVPWTYVMTEEVEEAQAQLVARVYSGTRRPLGVRRRGLVEQLAIALRFEPAPVTVQLRSRTAPSKALAGYEVFVDDTGSTDLALVGTTDFGGAITVEPGATPIRMLLLKHGGQLLARVPVVPGVEPQVEMHLPDDDSRLLAEAALASVRENLIDVVAQRNILIARARRQMDEGNLELAEKLVNELDGLPGRTHFDRQLEQLARQHVAADPQVQRRIDRLLSDTRSILAHFLDIRETNRLRDELNASRSAGG